MTLIGDSPYKTGTGPTQAMAAARQALLDLQSVPGWWKGTIASNVTTDAQDLMVRKFLGVDTPDQTVRTVRWIRSQQNPAGGWPTSYKAPADLSTTIEAYFALRLAGEAKDAPHMLLARDYVLQAGGLENCRVLTRMWLALFGQWPWSQLPVMAPEIVFLPAWAPLNLHDWIATARPGIVALTILGALRPIRQCRLDVNELRSGRRQPRKKVWSRHGAIATLDWALHLYERRPVRAVRRAALRRATEWILARQEDDGLWGGIHVISGLSLIALNAAGRSVNHPAVRRGLNGLDRLTAGDGSVEQMTSVVWDTVLAMNALLDCALPPEHPALVKASDWLLTREASGPGDWAVRRPGLVPGGWAYEFDNTHYPDTDDTAEAICAFRRVKHPTRDAEIAAATERATSWLAGMACRSGGFAAYDPDQTSQLPTKMPISDFAALIDVPAADITGRAIEALCHTPRSNQEVIRKAVDWLITKQRPDGSWLGQWGVNHLYALGAVVPALIAAGVGVETSVVRRAVSFLRGHQNDDGGWGEDVNSYIDPACIGRGESTPSQTAWALMAFIAADPHSSAADRGIGWLVEHQLPDGTWDEPQFTVTAFPGSYYCRDDLYRLVFPLMALGRYCWAHRLLRTK